MEFEWDVNKAQSNVEKRGVTFELARAVFYDPNATIVVDTRQDYGEIRCVIYGHIENRLYAVVFVRDKSAKLIRIISARKANKRERSRYANG